MTIALFHLFYAILLYFECKHSYSNFNLFVTLYSTLAMHCRDYDDDRGRDKDRERDRDRDRDSRSLGDESKSSSSNSLASVSTPVQPAQPAAAASMPAPALTMQKTVLTQNPFTGNQDELVYVYEYLAQ